MSESATRAWLRPRLAEAPPELAADIVALLESCPGLDLSDPVAALAGAALQGLAHVAEGTGERTEALRLLAADAALTYAFEAAAEEGTAAELAARLGLAGEIGERLEREVRERTLPGGAGS